MFCDDAKGRRTQRYRAIFLASSNSPNPNSDLQFDIVFGTLLVITVLGQLTADIFRESASHPSNAKSFEMIQTVLRSIIEPGFYQSVGEDVRRFQVLLYEIQKRGLGQRHTDLRDRLSVRLSNQ
jgi:hypothetical protein